MSPAEHTLRALVNGDLAAWHGLPQGADSAWVRDELGDVLTDYGELLIWRGGVSGPEGVLVELEGDDVELIELPDPNLGLEAMAPLGEPELELNTAWSRVGTQHAWPSRGLAVHASFDGIFRILAFAPIATADFRSHRFATDGEPPQRRQR